MQIRETSRSWRSDTIQVIYAMIHCIERYRDSAEERMKIGCSFDSHEIGEPPILGKKSTDRMSSVRTKSSIIVAISQ